MHLIKIATTLLSLGAAALSAAIPEPLTKRSFCIRYNTDDCRNFKLISVDSTKVDTYITVANSTNVHPRVPKALHGAFYMKGNPLPDEVLSIAGGRYDEKENAYYLRVYDEGMWSWSDNFEGKLLYESVRTFGLTYKMTWNKDETVFQVYPTFNLPLWLGNGDITIKEVFANFTILTTNDPNYFIRRSSFVSQETADYEWNRTPRFEKDYTYDAPAGFSTHHS
ncbi:hypothetical protein BC829DRAFT_395154 [Chytridium lagenaria]|nr:hypothetical protein BC829DRAFT_395154 [Chytridium lagenaria]